MDGPADIVFMEETFTTLILNKFFKTWREHMLLVTLMTWKNRLSGGHMQIIDLMGKDIQILSETVNALKHTALTSASRYFYTNISA